MRRWVCGSAAGVLVALLSVAAEPEAFPKLAPNKADEPRAKEISLARGAEFLDSVAVNWTQQRKCATCHTNVPYLMARPALTDGRAPGMDLVRKFFEQEVERWESGAKPRNDSEVVAVAAALARIFHRHF